MSGIASSAPALRHRPPIRCLLRHGMPPGSLAAVNPGERRCAVPGLDVAGPGRRFAFKGRVSTEDNQDPRGVLQLAEVPQPRPDRAGRRDHRRRVLRHRPVPVAAVETPPRAAQLLADLADPGRGFDAVVIGEPQRAFYGNQYSLIMPVFAHYGVELWVPEVGGPIDPDSEAHDLIMSVFGGLSKGERNRIKLRVRAAMAAQAAVEGRFLGGRPPYGYRLADAGPHPNPAKAADGKRLHKLEPDPDTAWVVRRIFAEYLAGARPVRHRRGPHPRRHPLPVPARPGPQPAPHRGRLVQDPPSAPSWPTPATPAGRSGTSSARTRSSSTSTTSPPAMRPGCAGTRPAAGSGPTPSPTSR